MYNTETDEERRGRKPQPANFVASSIITVRITPTERQLVEAMACEEASSLSELVREALSRYAAWRKHHGPTE